jgi:Zn-dependent protease
VHRTDEASKLASFPVMFTLVRLATINGFLIAFNLLPLPPLDGGRLALIFLPQDWSERLARLSPYPRTFGILLASLLLIPLFLIPFAGFLGFVINIS